ncbi:anthranilate synthase component I [Trichophyton tonsurans CBS 112818]|uniref:Anthranilate synthase component I n=1 Tax=Trichophyton tonsurans (strain CBS 112818) TaxID=647933 RepID=F2RQ92_TRIT1|nr:anthranilate synthase component I [Trichophyton tonsurans CBS 112818]
MAPRVIAQPSLDAVKDVLAQSRGSPNPPNMVPVTASIPADLLTPTVAYLKISADSKRSFLYESAATTETIGRYSFVGADPKDVLVSGPGHGPECDPLPLLEKEISQCRVATVPGLKLPPLTGGAIGYVGYDCVRYFEPKTARPMKDILCIPESLFYIDCADFQIVGASPELLVKKEADRIITHPIAGTVPRGKTPEEDEKLAEELRNSLKDRAEHVMLVDLARNDVNRVCDPATTQVDRLMVVEKFSHVQHLVSQVSGVLRPEKSRFDAFRSIFPAGTVSGAPKVRAMQLIAELEGEKRGVYAGAVGYFGYNRSSLDGKEIIDGAMDTCIALRTMVLKDNVAYLQAGGGIVFDSDPYDDV